MDADQLPVNDIQFGTECKNKRISKYPPKTETNRSETIDQSDISAISSSELNGIASNSCAHESMSLSNGIDPDTYESIKKVNCKQHDNVNIHSENGGGPAVGVCEVNNVPNANVYLCNQLTDNDCVNKPLLSEQQTKSRKPKSIVKSPSSVGFGAEFVAPKLSLPVVGYDNERPVLHVQFQHQNGVEASGYAIDKSNQCSSPVSSVSSTSSSSSSSDDESIGQYSEAKPPDGGWGWVVVFASFFVNLIADGITFSFGVIYVEFLNYFNEGKAKTAWIGSLFMAMPLLSGPIASFLTDRYGCRKVTIAGSILASLGFVISSFSTSMEMLFFTFGILSGFGLSLCYVAAVVIVAYYFDKRRSFATGLSVCGSGIGTFIFAPLTQVLLENYGWRGTTLILAGLFLNLTVCGMLMRDLEWTTHRAKLRAKERKKSKLGVSAESFSASNSTNTGGTSSNMQQPFNIGENDLGVGNEDGYHARPFSSLITLPTFIRNGEKVPMEVLELMSKHRNGRNTFMHTGLSYSRSFSEPLSSSRHSNVMSPETTLSPTNPERLRYEKTKCRKIENEQAFLTFLKRGGGIHHQKDRHKDAYLKDIKMHRHSLTYRGAMLNINRYRLRASSCPDIYRNSMTTIAKEKTQWSQGVDELKNVLLDMVDFSYFADMRFLLFAVSNFFLYTWYDVPYVYLTDNAIQIGFTETDASILISVIGIVNMVGEIILGWFGDKKYLTAGVIYAICMGFCGITTALVPLMKSYVGLSIVSGLFGLFIAANYALTSIILVELITLERFTNAYGLLLLVQGIANLVGPPLAGWITDLTGNYDLAFYLSGFFICVSGVLMFVLPVHGKYKKYRELRQQNSQCDEDVTHTQTTCNGTSISISDKFSKTLFKNGDRINEV
ncbi:hypothetical protein HA402_004177 [Bradysia odoriphaga]|nr:hypothetical protein HA402_004177 [Bradysia odoriphaga]